MSELIPEIKWDEMHEWKHRTENYLVIVRGWKPEAERFNGKTEFQEWNVYLYIYPNHPRFKDCKETMWGCPYDIPGISFYAKHTYDPDHTPKRVLETKGPISSHQYGNDYNHLWHEEQGYRGSDKRLEAFHDAKELIETIEANLQDLADAEKAELEVGHA